MIQRRRTMCRRTWTRWRSSRRRRRRSRATASRIRWTRTSPRSRPSSRRSSTSPFSAPPTAMHRRRRQQRRRGRRRSPSTWCSTTSSSRRAGPPSPSSPSASPTASSPSTSRSSSTSPSEGKTLSPFVFFFSEKTRTVQNSSGCRLKGRAELPAWGASEAGRAGSGRARVGVGPSQWHFFSPVEGENLWFLIHGLGPQLMALFLQ